MAPRLKWPMNRPKLSQCRITQNAKLRWDAFRHKVTYFSLNNPHWSVKLRRIMPQHETFYVLATLGRTVQSFCQWKRFIDRKFCFGKVMSGCTCIITAFEWSWWKTQSRFCNSFAISSVRCACMLVDRWSWPHHPDMTSTSEEYPLIRDAGPGFAI